MTGVPPEDQIATISYKLKIVVNIIISVQHVESNKAKHAFSIFGNIHVEFDCKLSVLNGASFIGRCKDPPCNWIIMSIVY